MTEASSAPETDQETTGLVAFVQKATDVLSESFLAYQQRKLWTGFIVFVSGGTFGVLAFWLGRATGV